MTWVDDVREFHAVCDQPDRKVPQLGSFDERKLRQRLLEEEFGEYMRGEMASDLTEIADALADMAYIICGTALTYGIPLDEVFAEVHRSNMAKAVDGKVMKREDGKILKPPGWTPPDVAGVLERAK